MSVRLLLEEFYCAPDKPRRFGRWLFLLIGVGALGYSGWIYVHEYIHERVESKAFDQARSRSPVNPEPGFQAPPAQPFQARLVIARLHLTAMVEEGAEEDTLRYAAGHVPGTALPGQSGNVSVAAHRDTLFRKLKGIRQGDRIVLSTLTTDYAYEVTATAIVQPSDVSVLAPIPGRKTLTLITCYPFYFIGAAPRRFIVHARQISETRAAPPADD